MSEGKDEERNAKEISDEEAEIEEWFRERGVNFQKPLTWHSHTGRFVIALTNVIFDLAEKVLVISAFSAAAQITSDASLSKLSSVFAFILAIYVIYLIEKPILTAMNALKLTGKRYYIVFVVATMAVTVLLFFILAPTISWLTNAIATVAG